MNRFKKINDNWCIETDPRDTAITEGCNIAVNLASGAVKFVTLGQQIGPGLFATAPRAAAPKVEIGSLDGILAVFEKAAKHLKFPAIVLHCPSVPGGVRVSRAGNRAKHPGTLNVTSGQKDDSEFGRTWYGRVQLDGSYQPSRDSVPAISSALQAFAADPVKAATEYGRLTGNCCFCRKALTDERSTAVGYGKICAGHYGLPWGATAVEAEDEWSKADEDRADRRLDWDDLAHTGTF